MIPIAPNPPPSLHRIHDLADIVAHHVHVGCGRARRGRERVGKQCATNAGAGFGSDAPHQAGIDGVFEKKRWDILFPDQSDDPGDSKASWVVMTLRCAGGIVATARLMSASRRASSSI
jgi:hypothetical protein